MSHRRGPAAKEKVDKKVPAETQIVPAKQPGKRPRVERTCVFCKVTSKGARFAEVQENKSSITLDCCEDCADIAMSIRPNRPLSSLIVIYSNVNGEASKDPLFKQEFDLSQQHRASHPLQATLFKPASTVMNSQTYGYSVFQDLAAVTEQEYSEMTGHPPDQLKFETDHCKLQPMQIPFLGPGSNLTLYGISLQELPSQFWQSVRKVRISFGSGATHQEAFLTPELQLHERHGQDVFKFVCGLHQQARPDALHLKGTATSVGGRLPTLAQLVARHDEIEAQIQQKLKEEQEPLLEAYGMQGESGDSNVAGRKVLGLGGGTLTKESQQAREKQAAAARQQNAKKRKAASAAAGSGADGAVLSLVASSAGTLEEINGKEDDQETSKKGGSLSKKGCEFESIKASLDDSLQDVAEKHLEMGGTSLKSFIGLTGENFLCLTHQHASDKSCSSSLLGAKKIVQTLGEKSGGANASEVLEQRVTECEHAMFLRQKLAKGLQHTPIIQIIAHITLTRKLWPISPLVMQTKLVFRFLLEDLRRTQPTLAADEAAQVKAWGKFASRLAFASAAGGDLVPFKGESMSVGDILSALLATASPNTADSSSQPSQVDFDGEMDVDKILEKEGTDQTGELKSPGAISPKEFQVQEAAEAFAQGLDDLFSSDEILVLMKMEKNSRAAFMALCKGYLGNHSMATSVLEGIKQRPLLAPILEAAQRLERFCKCFLYIFAENFEGVEASVQDVTAFSKYHGRAKFEKMIRQQLTQEGSFWADACADIVRCAGQAELLRPQLEEFRSFLDKDIGALQGTAALERILVLWGNLEAGTRKIEVEPLAAKFQQRLCEIGKLVMTMDAANVEAGFVDSLLKGLNRFPTIPGSMSTTKGLQGWLVSNRSSIAVSELVKTMADSTREKIDFELVITNLNRVQEKNAETPQKILDPLPDFLLKVCYNLLDKALLPTPAVDELKSSLPCLKRFAEIVQNIKEKCPEFVELAVLLDLYSQVISNGVFLRTTLNKIDGNGTSAKERLATDKNFQMLGYLHRARNKMQQDLAAVGKLQKEWLDNAGETAESAKASDCPITRLIVLDMSEKFAPVNEASNTMFEDLVGFQAAQFKSDLAVMANDMEQHCGGFQTSGAQNWKACLAKDVSIYKIFDAAAKIKVNPAQLMKCPTDFLKATADAEKFSQRFWEEHGANAALVDMDAAIKELLRGKVREARLLITELNMITALKSLVVANMESKMLRSLQQQLDFLDNSENEFGLTRADIHPALLAEVEGKIPAA